MHRSTMSKKKFTLLGLILLLGFLSFPHMVEGAEMVDSVVRSAPQSLGTSLAAAEGDMEWSRTYGGLDYDYASSVIETTDGGFALAGTSQSGGASCRDRVLQSV